jgi:RNA polymerase sigma-70 factor (ECF subfamily)
MDETELISAARLGDEGAFAELYRQHVRYVKAIGRSILRQKDVDDMCQDTFLVAFTRLDTFEGNSQFRTWISRIATNQCLITLRKGLQPSNGETNLLQVDEEMAADGVLDRCVFAGIDAQLEGIPARLDLNRLLRVLKPAQRRLLEMAYLEDIPDLEIAELLGTTLASVKSNIHQAKRRVREAQNKNEL